MSKITLNLGSILSQLLKDANANFTELYNAVSALQERANEDIQKAVVYDSVTDMRNGLNAGTDGAGNALDLVIGDEIYILDDDTPDFWVSDVNPSSSTGTIPSSWESGINYAFGKYVIRVSKSREIELVDYQKISNLVEALSANSDHTHYPSAKAVYDAILAVTNQMNSGFATLNSKIANAGKIQGIKVDGSDSTLDIDESGIVTIPKQTVTADDLEANYDTTATPTSRLINGTTYNAIKVEDTDVTLEVFNSDGEAVITQIIRPNDGFIYFCFEDNDTDTYTIRKVGGNAVSGGGSVDISDLEYRVGELENNMPAIYEHRVSLRGDFEKKGFIEDYYNFEGSSYVELSYFSHENDATTVWDDFYDLVNILPISGAGRTTSARGYVRLNLKEIVVEGVAVKLDDPIEIIAPIVDVYFSNRKLYISYSFFFWVKKTVVSTEFTSNKYFFGTDTFCIADGNPPVITNHSIRKFSEI